MRNEGSFLKLKKYNRDIIIKKCALYCFILGINQFIVSLNQFVNITINEHKYVPQTYIQLHTMAFTKLPT